MSVRILATKLYVPPISPSMVLRPRLVERLDRGLSRKLTLISAPAGFGKTSLASEWTGCCGRNELEAPGEPAAPNGLPVRTAWLSLDEEDNDPSRFLTYVVAALRTVAPGLGEGALSFLQSAQPLPITPALTPLLNEITTLASKLILVLDDYHVIDSRPIDDAVTYLIEHLPPQLHLVITIREDPQLPLARLRARNQLTEVRGADLRFTTSEAAGYLAGMGIDLSPTDLAALDDRTEGWIAGLQLAAIAMQSFAEQMPADALGREDLPGRFSGFIRAYAGDHRYIMDYLLEEVLQRQPESGRSFLLETSILERLHGPLCEAITGRAGGSAQLAALERGNFFVVPLDDQRRWYRYHHLFAEVLQAHLNKEQPDHVPVLHLRASAWFEQHGATSDAIRHALAAEDFTRAADLLEFAFPALSRDRLEVSMLGWLKALPEPLIRGRPVLCNLYAGALMQIGEMQGVEAWLKAAEQWLPPTDAPVQADAAALAMVAVNQEEWLRLPAAVAMHRAAHALLLGDVAEATGHARRARALATADDHLRRGGAAVLQGLALWTAGDLEAARQHYGGGMADLRRAGFLSDVLGSALALADIHIAQGCLSEAVRVYARGLQMAAEHGMPSLRGTADMLVGLSEVRREQNDLPAAAQLLARAEEQGEHTGLPQNRYRSRVALARLRELEGDGDAALALLDEAERVYSGDFSPNVRPVAALRARAWVAQGRLADALEWARGRGLAADDPPGYLREFEHITLARILLACYRRDREARVIREAAALLDRLGQAAQAGGREGSVIEIRVVQALVLQEQDDLQAALASLGQALALAGPEGYVRIFVDEGRPMAQLLRAASERQVHQAYAAALLAALEADRSRPASEAPRPAPRVAPTPAAPAAPAAPLVESLSQRELEVLRLFNTELSGPEIARELVVALSTVRTHTKSIYGKLGVGTRRAAVRRALELGLL
jgi:LuxR family maltose regulon positive regulatory protein